MCEKNRVKEHIKNKYEPLTKDEKQKQKYRKNMTDEQKKKYKDYQKQCRETKTDEQKKKKKIIKKNTEKI